MRLIVVKRIIKKPEGTLQSPKLFFKRLEGRPEFKLRVGDYRIIANTGEQEQIVFVRSVGHRREICKKH